MCLINSSMVYLHMYVVVELQLCKEIRELCSAKKKQKKTQIFVSKVTIYLYVNVLLNPSNNIYVFHVLKYGSVCISIL